MSLKVWMSSLEFTFVPCKWALSFNIYSNWRRNVFQWTAKLWTVSTQKNKSSSPNSAMYFRGWVRYVENFSFSFPHHISSRLTVCVIQTLSSPHSCVPPPARPAQRHYLHSASLFSSLQSNSHHSLLAISAWFWPMSTRQSLTVTTIFSPRKLDLLYSLLAITFCPRLQSARWQSLLVNTVHMPAYFTYRQSPPIERVLLPTPTQRSQSIWHDYTFRLIHMLLLFSPRSQALQGPEYSKNITYNPWPRACALSKLYIAKTCAIARAWLGVSKSPFISAEE